MCPDRCADDGLQLQLGDSHSAFRGGRNQRSILGEDARLVARLGLLPVFQALCDFRFREFDIQAARVDVKHDNVAILQSGNRTAACSLRRYVSHHQAPGGAAEAPVRQQSDRFAQPLADQRRRHAQHLPHAGTAARELEGEIQLVRQKISKHKDQLYQVKTNEQYRAMLKEIEAEEDNIRRIEDLILEKMIESEELQKQLKEATARLEEEKSRIAAEKNQLEGIAKASTEKRDQSVRERQELAAKLGEDIRVHYERVRRGRGGLALAEVREGKCMGCNVLLRPQLYYDVRAGEGLYECENCARILYSLERLSTPAEADGPQAIAPN